MNFILHEKMIYYKKNNDFYLCVSAAFKKKIFETVHDNNMHKKHDKALQ